MTILSVRLVGDPVLRTAADRVTRFDEKLRRLAEDMHQTMDDVNGVGLAGPQVGVSLRIFTYRVGDAVGTVCNPVLSFPEGVTGTDGGSEGCLSVPGLGFPLERPASVHLSGVDVDGSALEIDAEGLLARCFQHETDHLDGTLYVDRLLGEAKASAWGVIRRGDYDSRADAVARGRASTVGSAFGLGGSR